MIFGNIAAAFAAQPCGCAYCAGKSHFGQAEVQPGSFKPAADTAIPYYVSALLPEDTPKWGSSIAGTAALVTYSFMTSTPSYADAQDSFGFAAMNDAQQVAVAQALAVWSEVANITFVEVSDADGR
jgi:hypothetical protein